MKYAFIALHRLQFSVRTMCRFDYIEMFYNPKRKHVRNGMLSPVEFETQQKI